MYFSIVKMLTAAGGSRGDPLFIYISVILTLSLKIFYFFIFFLRQSMSA